MRDAVATQAPVRHFPGVDRRRSSSERSPSPEHFDGVAHVLVAERGPSARTVQIALCGGSQDMAPMHPLPALDIQGMGRLPARVGDRR